MTASEGAPILQVSGVDVSYRRLGSETLALRSASLEIARGECFGLAGESGCGKTTLLLAIMRYLPANARVRAGRVLFKGEDLLRKSQAELHSIYGSRITMVYQDPRTALNPCMTVGDQLSEVFRHHRAMSVEEALEASALALTRVRIPDAEDVMGRYPHQLSGGMLQRIVLAMALCVEPDLLILDEPTTGLDVTVQAAVLDLISELREDVNAAILYVSHNLGVISRVCDRVGIMYVGEMVEEGPVDIVLRQPIHPYTRGLLKCIPRLGENRAEVELEPIPGHVPSLESTPGACVFAPRCVHAQASCSTAWPEMQRAGAQHLVRCWRWREIPAFAKPVRSRSSVHVSAKDAFPLAEPVLKLDDLVKHYAEEGWHIGFLPRPGPVRAVDGVSLTVLGGQTLGLVGESGCGKSTLARCIVGLIQPNAGSVQLMGQSAMLPVEKRDASLLSQVQMVFQDPNSTLNPAHTIGGILGRALARLGQTHGERRLQAIQSLLRSVYLDDSYVDRHPSELSGGEKQRVAIARAFAGNPALIICDEPVSSLDVSVQAGILNLFSELQAKTHVSYLFISHDLSVVRYLADWIAVMYLGRLCEVGAASEVFGPPYHPYTKALLAAVPSLGGVRSPQADGTLAGPLPSAIHPPGGCRFNTRCSLTDGAQCSAQEPPWYEASPTHRIRCWRPIFEGRQDLGVSQLAHGEM